MRTPILLLQLALVALLLPGCGSGSSQDSGAALVGGDSPPPPREIPKEIRELVPSGAVAFFLATSLTELSIQLEEWGQTFENDRFAFSPEDLVEPFGVPVESLDITRPVAWAVEMHGFGAPAAVLIAPKGDGYSTFFAGPAPSGTTGDVGSLLDPLPGRVLAGRIDAAEILGVVRPFVEMAMTQQAAMGSGAPLTSSYKDLLDSAKAIELGLEFADGNVEIDASLTTLDGSPLAAVALSTAESLPLLGRYLANDYPMTYLSSTHEQFLQNYMTELQSAMSRLRSTSDDAWVEQVADFTADCSALVESIGPDQLVAGRIDGDGFEAIQVITARTDAKALLQDMRELMRHPGLREAGVHWTEVGTHKVAGADAFHGRLNLDPNTRSPLLEHHGRAQDDATKELEHVQKLFQTLFGPEGIDLRFFVDGKAIVVVAEGDEALLQQTAAQVTGQQGPQSALQQRVTSMGGKPLMFAELDLRAVLTGLSDLARRLAEDPTDVPDILAGDPVMMKCAVLADGSTYRSMSRLNLEEAMPLVEDFKATAEALEGY